MKYFSSNTSFLIIILMVAPIIVRKANPETMTGWFVARDLHWFLSLIAVGLMVFGSYKSFKIAKKNKRDNQKQILNEMSEIVI